MDCIESVAEEPFVTRWRAEGRQRVAANHTSFRHLVEEANHLFDAGDLASAAAWCEIAGLHAAASHCGLFASRELEGLVAKIARRALGRAQIPRGTAGRGRPRRILHVATYVVPIGGLSRMIWRWIDADRSGVHSVALVRQRRVIPRRLVEAVGQSGGVIHDLSQGPDDLISLGRSLQAVAAGADLVVLHVDTRDIVPLLAFSTASLRPNIAYLDHADHNLWLGTNVADIVINLRESGRRIAATRRGIEPDRLALLPIILDPIERRLSRREAKQRLGLDSDGLLLVSIARRVKYRAVDGLSYADAHLPFLKAHPQATLVVLGSGRRDEWAAAEREVPGRIIGLAESEHVALYYQAADIYVDSFPFVSTTSLLEAGSYGAPLVSRFPFPEGAEVLGADMPGLASTLIRTRSLAGYTEALTRLAASATMREALGEETRRGISEVHRGEAWNASLERLYAAAVQVDQVRPRDPDPEPPCFAAPDLFIPFVHGAPLSRDDLICAQLRLMPAKRRAWHCLEQAARRGLRSGVARDLVRGWIPSRFMARLPSALLSR